MPPQPSSDLRVLCRKLASLSPVRLPRSLPTLINHVLRSKDALSAPHDSKLKSDASETSMLVHKLKINITTLLNGRTREARFVAISLVKAAVDVGGWEILREVEPWVRGLLSVIQKSDPYASKELAIATLTKIYILLHPYQALVREIATPTIPEFAKACLQTIKASTPEQLSVIPPSIIESVCDAFSTLIPLYPATLRPSSSQTYAAIRNFLVPTPSDEFIVPRTLQRAARRLAITQHHVAAKSGGSDEWARLADMILQQFHATADQVFRAVDESGESSSERGPAQVSLDGDPSGGGSELSEFPPWSGIDSGAARLCGLFEFISSFLNYPTKGSVSIPLGKTLDAVSRVCLIARLSPKTQTWAQALQTKAAISREEKDDLWSLMPDLHVAALQVVQGTISTLEGGMIPAASEMLDHLVRVFNSGAGIPAVRAASYSTLREVLPLAGPTLPKQMVEALEPVLSSCCRDLLEDSGQFKVPSKSAASSVGTTKKNGFAANADSFLKPSQETPEKLKAPLDPEHKTAAAALLVSAFSHLPQQHLKCRSLLDQTSILTSNRDAMLASVLNPYLDKKGRTVASVLPYLTQQYPEDRALEILRSNLRTDVSRTSKSGADLSDSHEEEEDEDEDEDENEDEEMADGDEKEEEDAAQEAEQADHLLQPGTLPAAPQMDLDMPARENPFQPKTGEKHTVYGGFGDVQPRAESPPKRKYDGSSPVPPKRQEVQREPATAPPVLVSSGEEVDDSDESVHLNMELEDDDDTDGDA